VCALRISIAIVVGALGATGCGNRMPPPRTTSASPFFAARDPWEDAERAREMASLVGEGGYVEFIRTNVRATEQRLRTATALFVTRPGTLQVGDERLVVDLGEVLVVPSGTRFSSRTVPCVEAVVVAPAGGLADLEIGTCRPLRAEEAEHP
jgi:hypothetical protein